MKAKKLTCLIARIIVVLFVLTACLSSFSAKAREKSKSVDLHPAYMADNLNYGYIDDNGKFVIGQKFQAAGDFSPEGYAIVQTNNWRYGVIDKSGNYMIPAIYNDIRDFENGFAVFTGNNGSYQGIINMSGKVIVKPEYMQMNNFCDGVAVGLKYDNQGNYTSYAFDTTGKQLFSCNGFLGKFNNGLALLQDSKTRLYGYVNKSGMLVIKQQYNYANDFSDGKAEVRIGSDYYDINSTGNILRKKSEGEQNNLYHRFDNGFYLKREGSFMTLYDSRGRAVISNVSIIDKINAQLFEVTRHLDSGTFLYDNQVPKAIFDKTGKRLTDYIYCSITQLENGVIVLCTQNQTYLVDANLKEISSFPKLQGVWKLSLSGHLIKATYSNIIRYYTKQGKLIFQNDGITAVNGGVKISSHIYSGIYVGIIYPQIEEMNDKHIKNILNTKIKARFITDHVKSIPSSDSAYHISSSFSQIGDILHIKATGSEGSRYLTMAAPKTIQADYYFDMKTGVEYKFDDLFKNDSDYKSFIQSNVFHIDGNYQQWSNGSTQINYNKITGFEVMKDKIQLYYIVYAVYGQPTYYCDLTYEQLDKFIDKSSAFWQSIQKFKE